VEGKAKSLTVLAKWLYNCYYLAYMTDGNITANEGQELEVASAAAAPSFDHDDDHDDEIREDGARLYEIGYLLSARLTEEDIEAKVLGLKDEITSHGGSIVEDGAYGMHDLAYTVSVVRNNKREDHDKATFGWFKFFLTPEVAHELVDIMKTHEEVIRSIIMKTKRTVVPRIVSGFRQRATEDVGPVLSPLSPRETPGPVSDAELDREIENLLKE